jgi:hypothetical protein
MYFTQLHAIPENDEWWGTGYTDWNKVKTAAAQYAGHYQPRIPLNSNYYDQSDLKTIRWQVDLAKRHGIYGFCHYHYWFDGKQLLETPTNLMLENKDIEFPFCLSWANETWSRRWDGLGHHILMEQTHPPFEENWKRHYDYLIRAWTDPRAIKVDGKPVFVIYRPQHIEKIDEMLAYWRRLAMLDGLPGLYFIFQKQYELSTSEYVRSFDALFQFQPFESVNSPSYRRNLLHRVLMFGVIRKLPERYQVLVREFKSKLKGKLTFHDYDETWRKIVELRPDAQLTTYPGAFVDWDNAARYKERATIFKGASPEKFEAWLKKLLETMPSRNLPENFIFLNAWNEWSEAAYLEPDEKHGDAYLEAVKRLLVKRNA